MIYLFPGLSMAIHLLVVVIGNIATFCVYCYRKVAYFFRKEYRKKIFSLIITFVITVSVVMASSYMVYISLRSDTSNVKIMAHILQSTRAYLIASLHL